MSKKDLSFSVDETAYIKFMTEEKLVTKVDILCNKMGESFSLNNELVSNSESIQVLALEKGAGFEVNKRVDILRVITDELIRASSHLFNLSVSCHMLDEYPLMSKTMQSRYLINEIKELIWHNKLDCNISVLCGVKHDIDVIKAMTIIKKLKELESKIDKLINNYETNKNIYERTKKIGILSNTDALAYGLTGPVGRASGINSDVRKNTPYGIYNELNFKLITKNDGDVHSRMMVRCLEVKESILIIKQALEMLSNNKLIVYKKLDLSQIETSIRVEAPRGELFCFLKTNEQGTIIKKDLRVPSLMNWEVLKIILKGNKTSDIPLILNSIDPCLCM